MKKKMSLVLVFLAFFGFLAFGDTGEQEEIDFLLFLPNSSSRFVNQEQAMIQLDYLARYLLDRNLTPGQIDVYGYAAAAVNDIEPVNLSKDRALFVINELQKRGVAGNLFAAPVGYGSVDLWGGNTNERDRSPNRRVRILLDGNLLTPAAVKAAEPEISTPSIDTVEEPIPQENVTVESGSKLPWIILIILILIAVIAAMFFLASRHKRSSAGETKQETVPPETEAESIPPKKADDSVAVVPAPLPAAPSEKVKVLDEEEIRRHAYELFVQRNSQNGDAVGDWYQSMHELITYYEAQGYRVILEWELEHV